MLRGTVLPGNVSQVEHTAADVLQLSVHLMTMLNLEMLPKIILHELVGIFHQTCQVPSCYI